MDRQDDIRDGRVVEDRMLLGQIKLPGAFRASGSRRAGISHRAIISKIPLLSGESAQLTLV